MVHRVSPCPCLRTKGLGFDHDPRPRGVGLVSTVFRPGKRREPKSQRFELRTPRVRRVPGTLEAREVPPEGIRLVARCTTAGCRR